MVIRILRAAKTTFWLLILGLALSGTSAVAELTGGHGIWIDPPGWIGECFVCPDNVTSDCMVAEPVYIKLVRNHTLHVTQRYPIAWSVETELQYDGVLSLTVHALSRAKHGKPNEVMAVVTGHWRREDGFRVSLRQQMQLRYVDGQVEVFHEHDSFTCH